MKEIFKDTSIFSSLEKRFNPAKYIYFSIPYIVVKYNGKELFPKVLEPEEIDMYAEAHEIKDLIVVFKKLNWTIDHEIRRQSRTFNLGNFKYEFNFSKYCELAIRKLLVLVIDSKTNSEQYIDQNAVKNLHTSFAEGLVSYFFKNQPHQDDMDDEEQAELSLSIHNFLSYHRKKQQGHPSVTGMEAPPCPAIIIEKGLAEDTGWTLDYIRSLEYRDVIAMNIYETQKNVNEHEGNARPEGMVVNVNGAIQNVKSIADAKKLMGVEEEMLEGEEDFEASSENQNTSDVVPDMVVGSFLDNLLGNTDSMADSFFEQAQKQNKII